MREDEPAPLLPDGGNGVVEIRADEILKLVQENVGRVDDVPGERDDRIQDFVDRYTPMVLPMWVSMRP